MNVTTERTNDRTIWKLICGFHSLVWRLFRALSFIEIKKTTILINWNSLEITWWSSLIGRRSSVDVFLIHWICTKSNRNDSHLHVSPANVYSFSDKSKNDNIRRERTGFEIISKIPFWLRTKSIFMRRQTTKKRENTKLKLKFISFEMNFCCFCGHRYFVSFSIPTVSTLTSVRKKWWKNDCKFHNAPLQEQTSRAHSEGANAVRRELYVRRRVKRNIRSSNYNRIENNKNKREKCGAKWNRSSDRATK